MSDYQTQVPANGAGGSDTGMPPYPTNGDVGPENDFDQRLNQRIERMAGDFRSIMDRNLAKLSQQHTAEIAQLRQQNQTLSQQMARIDGYLTQAQEAELPDDERQRRQQERQQQANRGQYEQVALNARQQNAAFKVMRVIAKWGYDWNDPRLAWHPELYQSDPDGWASQVIADAADAHDRDRQESVRSAQEATRSTQAERGQQLQERQQVETQNQRRAVQAAAVDTTAPSGPQSDWYEKTQQMTAQERRDYIRNIQRKIKHAPVDPQTGRPAAPASILNER